MEPEAIPITKKFLRLFFVYGGAVPAPLVFCPDPNGNSERKAPEDKFCRLPEDFQQAAALFCSFYAVSRHLP